MKLSMSISATPTRFSAMALQSNLEENIGKVIKAGFDAVELSVRDPRLIDVAGLKSVLARHHAAVTAIGTGQAYLEEQLSFVDGDPSVRDRALARIKEQIDLAALLGAKVIIGLIRGRREAGVTEEQAREWLVQNLQACSGYAGELGVDILLEPINRYETNLLNTIGECLPLLEAVGAGNLLLLPDTFHMNIEERDILASIREAGPHIGHFHAADSNRWAPGSGHLDFPAIFKTLKGTGYDGAIAVEIIPGPDPDTAVRQAVIYLREVFKGL